MIKNLLIKTLLLVNVVIILAMLLTGFACMLDPVRWGWLSMAGYVFPIPLALNMLMIAVWVFVKFRYVLVPVAGMLVCYVPVTTYTPVNLPTQDDGFGGGIRVMSYNTWGLSLNSDFGKEHGADEARRELFRYIRDQHPDIVCLQESFIKDYYQPDIDSLLTPHAALQRHAHGEPRQFPRPVLALSDSEEGADKV